MGEAIGKQANKQASKVHYIWSRCNIVVTSSTFLFKGSLVAVNTQVL